MKQNVPMQPDPKNNEDIPIGRIIAIVVLFSLGLWPVAIFLIWQTISKSESFKKRRLPRNKPREPRDDGKIYGDFEPYSAPRRPYAPPPTAQPDIKVRPQGQTAASDSRASNWENAQTSATPFDGRAKKSPWWYGILNVLGVATLIGGCILSIVGLNHLIIGALFSVVGTLFMVSGMLSLLGISSLMIPRTHAQKLARKNRFYNVIGSRKVMKLEDISATLGIAYPQAVKELQTYLDKGMFPGGYIDHSRRLLVVSAEGLDAFKQDEPPKSAEKASATSDARSNIIEQIREVNTRIADKQVSEKINRIESITGQILDTVAREPEKEKKISAFMNYYLPTTLKILDAYERFEETDVRGENIQTAMRDIENILNHLVLGFERQLDLLYESNVLDISSDISVLESMLAKDGLTDGSYTIPHNRQ